VIVVQTFNRDGWPPDSTIELEDGTAAAILTAARDFQAETGIDLNGDLIAVPAGGLRPDAWIIEMQWAFDHRHDTGANKAKSLALYSHYNMDTASNARPFLGSLHRTGFALDVADSRFLAWLILNGHRYGLRRTLVAENDLRHFQYFPGTATVALDITSLNNDTQEEPPMADTVVFQETTGNPAVPQNDWTRTGNGVLPVLDSAGKALYPGGYEATTDIKVARIWLNEAGQTNTGPIQLDRTPYIAQQTFAAKEYALHRADQIARLKEALGGLSTSVPTDYVTKTDLNNATANGVAAVIKAIPRSFTAA